MQGLPILAPAHCSIPTLDLSTPARTRSYAAAVTQMEETLAGQGHRASDFEGPTTFSKPYRATLLARLALNLAALGSPPRVVCETGFGAGHSTLLWVALSTGTSPSLPSRVTVHSFDHGLAKHTLAAHDYIDEHWPQALVLYLGEKSAVTWVPPTQLH